ncbi:MAG TPA: DUF4097 family beta strand repeat-containing protein [Candidatus Acidoferrales bacterium]|nr:DUF4097 family beta strand repeat-containing protein [Candidatus Acidoferrales bacterium]
MSNGAPRPRSALGPLVLVAVGAIFLLSNFRPGWIPWDFFARWWPLLLILWGAVRLIENLSGTGRRGVSGGEVFLLVLVIFAGIGSSVASRFPGMIRMDNSDDFPFSETAEATEELPARDVPPGSLLRIDTPRGDVTVDGSGDDKQMHIVVHKTGYAMSGDEAKSRADSSTARLEQSGTEFSLSAAPAGGRGSSSRVSFEVHLPRNVALDLRTARGEVRVTGIAGNVAVSVGNGNVEVRDTGGDVRADLGHGDARVTSVKGNVHVSGKGGEVEIADVKGAATIDGEFFGPISARSVAQGVRFVSRQTDFTLAGLPGRMTVGPSDLEVEDAVGPLILTTKDKQIDIEDVSGRIRVDNRHGRVAVRLKSEPREEIDLTNDSGAIELALPSKSAFDISAASRSGEIENDWNDGALNRTREKGDSRLDGKVGAKGPKITLNTSYGPIRLKRSD